MGDLTLLVDLLSCPLNALKKLKIANDPIRSFPRVFFFKKILKNFKVYFFPKSQKEGRGQEGGEERRLVHRQTRKVKQIIVF